jgi:hypothetical protein
LDISGTLFNAVRREGVKVPLALDYPDKKVVDLHNSLCPNMFKINLGNLLWTLNNIGEVNGDRPDQAKAEAKVALTECCCAVRRSMARYVQDLQTSGPARNPSPRGC